MQTVTITCEICGKTFEIAAYRLKHNRGKCCSKECSYKARGAAQMKPVEKMCERCGKTFTITPSMNAKGKGRFCSAECKWPPITTTCLHCGKEFRYSPSSKRQYCSRECAYASGQRSDVVRQRTLEQWRTPHKRIRTLAGIKRRSKSETWLKRSYFQKGKASPFYKNGNAQSAKRPQNGPETQWRRDVFRRDDYTCRNCGAKGGRLNAHHIESWIDNPELRHDLANGVTLCVTCHLATHGKQSTPKHYRCIDCGTLKTSQRSPRCQSCAMKHSYDMRGRKHPKQ